MMNIIIKHTPVPNIMEYIVVQNHFTLRVMAYVSILVPFVLAYIFYAWRSIDKKKIDVQEMQEEGGHAY